MDQLSPAPRVVPDDETDRALLQRFRAGDREAFAELVVRYQKPIYNAALWILRRPEDASDIAQTVFLKVAERLDEYDEQYRFFSWIYRIAINESLNLLRRGDREDPLEDGAEFSAPEREGPEQQFVHGRTAERIQKALRQLSSRDRTVITLRHYSECSYEEMAEILGIDEKTVKSRLYEARQRLRQMLSDFRPE